MDGVGCLFFGRWFLNIRPTNKKSCPYKQLLIKYKLESLFDHNIIWNAGLRGAHHLSHAL
jgi:hypothetical protein